jgi:hypothetical protein
MSYRAEIRNRLIEVAKKGRTINYQELMIEFGLTRGGYPNAENKVGDAVGDISNFENSNGRPRISSIVVHKSDGYPGGGFFGLDDIPEPLKREPKEFNNPLSLDDKKFVEAEQKRVWDYWNKHDH